MQKHYLALTICGVLVGCGSSDSNDSGPKDTVKACSIFGEEYQDGDVTYTALLVGDPEAIEAFDVDIPVEEGTDAGELCNQLSLTSKQALYVDNYGDSLYRGLYELNVEEVAMWWQGAGQNPVPDSYGQAVEEAIFFKGLLDWRLKSWKYIDETTQGWTATIGEGSDDSEVVELFDTQEEAIEFAEINTSKLIKAYEIESQWDDIYSVWVSIGEQTTNLAQSQFVNREETEYSH